MTAQETQQTTAKDDHLQQLRPYIIIIWPESRNEVPQKVRLYGTFWDDIAVIEGLILISEQS